jgi:hypothetical protein
VPQAEFATGSTQSNKDGASVPKSIPEDRTKPDLKIVFLNEFCVLKQADSPGKRAR